MNAHVDPGNRITTYSNDPDLKARAFSVEVLEAVPVGADLTGVDDRLSIERLREECLPLAPQWPESIREEVISAIEGVIAVLSSGEGDREAAAWAARAAAASSPSAFWSREADRLLTALRENRDGVKAEEEAA